MSENNKNYLLFILSDTEGDNKFIKDIPIQLMPVTTSKYLKFNHSNFGMVCNFQTDLPFDELKEFIMVTLDGIVEQFFLMEHPDNMAVHMPNNLKLNLFDLTKDNDDYSETDNMSDKQGEEEIFKIQDYFLNRDVTPIIDPQELINFIMNNEDDEDVDEDPLIVKLKMRRKAAEDRPSLDMLLEKIKEKGIESLTKYENQLLNEYARN